MQWRWWLPLALLILGCGARASAPALDPGLDPALDYEAIFGHHVADLTLTPPGGRGEGTIVAGRLKQDCPPGLAGSLPWEGRWVPFIAELDERQQLRWIRELSSSRSVPWLRHDPLGGRWLVSREGRGELIERLGIRDLTYVDLSDPGRPGDD